MPFLRLFPTLTLLTLALGVAVGAQAAADRGIIIEPGGRGPSNRLALVIGNDYDGESGHLQNPTHDADDMRKALSKLGFTVMGDNQQSLEEMNALVREFGDRLRPGMIGLFYFAGHGMQINGQNYLIPEQSAIQREDEVPFRALAVDQVLAKMAKNKTGLNLLMLDACRDNPFARSFRSGATGLAKMEAPSGTLISYAAKPGTRSKDGNGRNGLYTSVLLKYLPIPGMPIEQMLNKVGSDVRRLSNEEQLTWKEGLLDSADGADFCFAGCGGGGPTPTTPPYRPVTPPPAPEPEPAPAPRPIPQRQTVTPRPAPVTPAVTPPPRPAPPAEACADCPEMVRLPGGSFMMGSTATETGSDQDERPRHSVTVKPFALGKYEVTRAQYAAFVDATGYRGGSSCRTLENGKFEDRTGRGWRNPGYSQSGNHPVVCVSLEDAEAYARWLSGQTGRRYRLPTEAEWEYAARSGTDTARYWGDDPDRACDYANVADQTAKKEFPQWTVHDCADDAVHTTTVGSYRSNRWGLFDMLGNVWEWTCSAYTEGGYDGHENKCINDASSRRVFRGGSWLIKPGNVRSANRLRYAPTFRDGGLGFRLAQD